MTSSSAPQGTGSWFSMRARRHAVVSWRPPQRHLPRAHRWC